MSSAKIDTGRLLAALEQRRAMLGELRGDGEPLTWTEVASQVGCHSATFSRLRAGTAPGETIMRRIARWLGVSESAFNEIELVGEAGPELVNLGLPDEYNRTLTEAYAGTVIDQSFGIIGDTTLPVGDRGAAWDGGEATARVFEAATSGDSVNTEMVARAHLYRDPKFDPQDKQAYKLPFADMVNGKMMMFPKGVAAVAAGHGIAQADIPEPDKKKLRAKVCVLYERIRGKYEDWPSCPFENVTPKEQSVSDFKDYSPEARERLAKEGKALPDGSFPIEDCADLSNAIQAIGRAKDQDAAKAHIKKRKKALDCEDVDLPEGWSLSVEDEMADEDEPCPCEAEEADCECEEHESLKTAAIIGKGRLSESEDQQTQSMISRVQELLREGAVGVSIKHDLDPDDMPSKDQISALLEAGDLEGLDALLGAVKGRPRHLAIVDTAAFSDARLKLGDDGFSVEGPITFEGVWTGDVRDLPFGGLVWDSVLPIPITMGHEGPGGTQPPVIGYIDEMERVEGQTSGVRPEVVEDEDIEAVAAAAGSDTLPAKFFQRFAAKEETPLTISEPDADGLRHIYGHAVPHGVCHRSDMQPCFQYPGDVDPAHRGFHTGSLVKLSDGTSVRVGALTFGGGHIDTNLAKQGVSYLNVGNHRDDSNKVFAVVHAWEDRYGLAVSGVVIPGMDRGDLLRAKASAPSVELWPKGSGRTLVGIHLVPTPAWPVAASAGSAEFQTMATSVRVEEDLEALPEVDELADIRASLSRLEKAVGLLAASALTDVPEPEDAE